MPISILIKGFAIPFEIVSLIRESCCDFVNSYQNCMGECDWCIKGIMFLIVALPPLLILIALSIPTGFITLALLIVPGYLCAILSVFNMLIWSCKTRKIQQEFRQ